MSAPVQEIHTEDCRHTWSEGDGACDCGLWPTTGPMCVEELGWLRSHYTPPAPPDECRHCGSSNMVVGEMSAAGVVWYCGDITEPRGSSERTKHWDRSQVRQYRLGSTRTIRALDELGRARGSALIDGVLVQYEHTVEDEVHVRIDTRLGWLDRLRLLVRGRFRMHVHTPVQHPIGPSVLKAGESEILFVPARIWPWWPRRRVVMGAGHEPPALRDARRPSSDDDDEADSGP